MDWTKRATYVRTYIMYEQVQYQETQPFRGNTALMLAAAARHADVVYALLSEYQCPNDTKNKIGSTLQHYACMHRWQCQYM